MSIIDKIKKISPILLNKIALIEALLANNLEYQKLINK